MSKTPPKFQPRMAQQPPVFVLGLFDTGLAALRLLAGSGVWVEGFDHEPNSAGFATRLAPTHLVDDTFGPNDPLLHLIRCRTNALKAGKAILLPSSDHYVQWLYEHREALSECSRWLMPSMPSLKLLLRKDSQAALARQAGLRVPWTVLLPHTLDKKSFAALTTDESSPCEYPLLLKPAEVGRNSERFPGKGLLVGSLTELQKAFDTARRLRLDTIAQEMIPGPVTQNFEVSYYVSSSGALESVFVMRKLRQQPPELGTACYGVTEPDPERVRQLTALVGRWVTATQYRGIGNTEFKWDPRSKEFVYIETNLRVWQQVDLAARAGQNFPLMLYSDLTGCLANTATGRFKAGLRWSDPLRDAQALLHAARSWRGRVKGIFWTWPLDTARASSRGVFALGDLGPGLKALQYGTGLPHAGLSLVRRVFSHTLH